MFEKIKSYLKSLRMSLNTKEVQPLSAKSAQSIQYFGVNYDSETMIAKYKKDVFDNIKQVVSESKRNYTLIEKPLWISKEEFNDFMLELIKLEYKVRKIEEVNISVIFWNE